MWKKYFKIVGIKAGVVIYPRPFGRVDFRNDNLDPEKLRQIFEADHPYLKMTDAGIDYFYADKNDADQNDGVIASEAKQSIFTAKDLVANIKKAKDEEQLRYFYGLGKQFVSVQKAYDKKVLEFYPGS